MKTGILITLLTVVVLWAESVTITADKKCTLFVDPASQLYEPRIIEIPFTMDWGTLDDTEERRCTVITKDPALNIRYSEFYKTGTLYYVCDYNSPEKELFLQLEARSWHEPDSGDTVDLVVVPCSLSVTVVNKNDIKSSQFEWLNTSEGLLSNNIKNVVVIDSNNIWIHYGELGSLTHIKDGQITHWNESTGLPDKGAWKIIPFKKGVIALCCDGEELTSPKTFAYLDGEQCHVYDHKACEDLTFPTVTVSPDNEHAWMSYQERGGFACFDGGNWKYFDTTNGLSSPDRVSFVFPETHGVIWVTYQIDHTVIDKFDGTNWQAVTSLDTIPVDSISLYGTDGNSGLYFLDWQSRGYGYFANDSLTMYKGTGVDFDYRAERISPKPGGNGSLWIRREGINRDRLIHCNKRDHKIYNNDGTDLLSYDFGNFYGNSIGQIWLAYVRTGHISFYDGDTWNLFDDDQFLDRVEHMYSIENDKAWFVYHNYNQENGISYYEDGHIKHFTVKDGLPHYSDKDLYTLGGGKALVVPYNNIGAYIISKDMETPIEHTTPSNVSTFSIAPMKGKFLLSNCPEKKISLKIYTVRGQLLQSQKMLVNTNRELLSLPKSLSAGCYIVSVEAGMHSLSQRFVVQ